MLKRMIVLVVAVMMVLSLAACAGDVTDGTDNSAGNEGNTDADTAETTDVASDDVDAEPVELVFWEMQWGFTDSWAPTVEGLVEQFNDEHPGIHVTVQIIPWDNYYQQFLTAVTSGAAPDVSTGSFNQSIQYAAMDEILDLSSIVEEWKADGTYDDFLPGSMELHQYNGIQAGIPWTTDPRVINYRTDIFEQAGIDKLPETWDEFKQVCEQIEENTDAWPFAFAAGDHSANQAMINLMVSFGIGICDEDGNATFNDPKVIEILEWFDSMVDEGYAPEGVASYTTTDLERLFAAGEVAMVMTNTQRGAGNDAEIGQYVRILPTFKSASGDIRNLTWVNPIVAYKQTEHPDEAKVFIKWWVENNLPLFTEGEAVTYPARKSFFEDDFYATETLSVDVMNGVFDYGVPPTWPTPNLYTAFSQIDGENYVGKALQEVLTTENPDYEAIANKYNEMIAEAIAEQ